MLQVRPNGQSKLPPQAKTALVTIGLTQRPALLAEWALQNRPIGQSMLLSQGIDMTAERAADNGNTRTANAAKINTPNNFWNDLVIHLSLEKYFQARRGRLHQTPPQSTIWD